MPLTQIPTVDFTALNSLDLHARNEAEQALKLGFSKFGLAYIKNSGIDRQNLNRFYDAFLNFTHKDEAEKETLSQPDIWFQRGWTPPNTEQAVIAGGQADFKECYFIAPERLPGHYKARYPALYADNIWPKDVPYFKEGFLNMGQSLQAIGVTLLRACAKALGLEAHTFEEKVYDGPHVTRALHYLALKEEQLNQGILWGEEHTDFNLLTLLPGGRFLDQNQASCERPDDVAGLYLRTRSSAEHPEGLMLRGAPPKDCIVVQVGQQFEILTGGIFQATPHVIKAPLTAGYERLSLAHFVHTRVDQVLEPLDPFRSPEAIAAYSPPVLAGTYATKTLVDIHLAPKSALEQLGYRQYARLENIRKKEDSAL